MNKSFLSPTLKCILIFLSYFSIAFLVRKLIICLKRRKNPSLIVQPYEPRLWNEFYVVFALFISSVNLWFILPEIIYSTHVYYIIIIAIILPIYRISEILRTATAIIFIDRENRFLEEKENKGIHYILVGNLNSWLIMILLKWIDMITCFAVLTLFLGYGWNPEIKYPLDAFYASVVTMLTVGYGDFHPISSPAKILVIIQLFCFISYVLLLFPIVASSFKTLELNLKK